MAIDVLVKQKLFGNKVMPLEVILGKKLHYGTFENDQLTVGELGENQFIAYNPDSIGRGFCVVWNPQEKKAISLRLPQPSTTEELRDFYNAIERMVKYWDGKLIVDGNQVHLPEFLSTFNNMVDLNYRFIKQLSQKALNGEHDSLTLYSTKWPLSIGKQEATIFLENPDYYAEWLHKKQSMDVYFASPNFYVGDNGISARFYLINNLPAVFPQKPAVPFGTIDPATGKQLECKEWLILLGIEGKNEPLCEMEYSKFLRLIPESKKSRYDANRFLLSEFTEEEIQALAIQ